MPKGKTRPSREGRQNQIRGTAARLFTERGYDAVTVREIAAAAGITQPTLYRYFGSKQQLLTSIYEAAQAENRDRFAKVAALDATAETKLRLLFREAFLQQTDMLPEAAVFHRELRALPPEFSQPQLPIRREIDRYVRDILQQGVDERLWTDERCLEARMILWGSMKFLPDWFRSTGA